MNLGPDETDLIGSWRMVDGAVDADATARRIDLLVRTQLQRLGSDPSGWDTLFRDPIDERLWELTYPAGDTQGGGPPRLTCLSAESARRKYGGIVDAR